MKDAILVPISAIEHWSYCPRQCGLIHVESVWDENLFTIKGTAAHERADQPTTRLEKGVRTERALPVWSDRLGLVGKCDVVEFHPNGEVVPVEYKSGGPNHARHAELQLCAQALCLEEMQGRAVTAGALYFAKTRERQVVSIDAELRAQTERILEQIREMLDAMHLPDPVNDRRCPRCSLIDACLPGPITRLSACQPSIFQPGAERELP